MAIGYGPVLPTDGLVLLLDAANKRSYPGTGTTVVDLSGTGNNSTLVNSPTYSTANGGMWSLNGTTQRIDVTNNDNLRITVGTIGAWFRANSGNSGFNGIITKQSAWGLFVQDNVLITYDWSTSSSRSTGITVGNDQWNLAVLSFTETTGTPSNNATVYLNGASVLTATVKTNNQSTGVQIGDGNASQNLGGDVSMGFIYNRVLPASEVFQIFNAHRGRYGI